MAQEIRTRSYRNGTTLSGGESTAHFYMNLASTTAVPIAMLENGNPNSEETKRLQNAGKRGRTKLTIVGALQPVDTEEAPLFATELDEDVLTAARTKMQAKFGLVTWQPKTTATDRLEDVINPKVTSYLHEAEGSLTTNKPETCLRLLVRVNHLDKERLAALEGQMRFVALTELCDFQAAHVMATRANFPVERLSWCFFAYGQSSMDIGMFSQALNAFTMASRLEPDRIEHKLKQIEALYRMKHYIECIGIVTDLIRENRKDKARLTDLFTLRARLQELLSNVKEVLNDIQRALKIDPDHLGANNFLQDFRRKANDLRDEAMVMYAKGRFREASDRLTTCIQTNPDNADYYFKRGLVYRRLGDYRKAVDDLLEAMAKMEVAADLNNIPADTMGDARHQLILLLNDMAIDCYKRGMYDDSIRLLDRAIRFDKNEIAFYVNRGDCFYALEEFESALNDYEQANELVADHEAITSRIVLIHSHRGLLAMRDRNFTDADAALSEAIKVRPHDYDLRVLRCRARLMLGNNRDAAHDIVAALVLNAPTSDPHVSTLLPRLFPGMNAEEVLTSETGRLVFADMGLRNDDDRKLSSITSGSRFTIGTMAFSAEVVQLMNEKLLVTEEMHVLASDINREGWIKFAAKLAPRTTKWRGTTDGPLDRPLSRPGVARLHPDGTIKLVSNKKSNYAFRWQAANVKSLTTKRKKSPQKLTREDTKASTVHFNN